MILQTGAKFFRSGKARQGSPQNGTLEVFYRKMIEDDLFFGEFSPSEPIEGLLITLAPPEPARRVLAQLPAPRWQREYQGEIRCLFPFKEGILLSLSRALKEAEDLQVETRLVNPPLKPSFKLAGLKVAFRASIPADIYLDPGPAFGSGHHPSTTLAAEALKALAPLEGQSLLDVGTGTGILALIGARLGASPVVALEPDKEALLRAYKNFQKNNLPPLTIAGYLPAVKGGFDIVMANLVPAVLTTAATELKERTKGVLIISGFRQEKMAEMIGLFEPFKPKWRQSLNGWGCLILTPP